MLQQNSIKYQAKLNGYYFYEDTDNFISIFASPLTFTPADKEIECIYRCKCNSKSQKEFEVEISYLLQTIEVMTYS